jgi:hypothetical protein
MCPACLATIAVTTAATASGGAATAIVAKWLGVVPGIRRLAARRSNRFAPKREESQ